MKKVLILAIISTIMLAGYSCSKDTGATTPTTADPSITYSKDIAPIMTNYCTSCHSQYSTKSGVTSAINAIISSIQNGSMPPGSTKVSAAELTKLKTWDRVQ